MRGYTVLELMIVIGTVAILATIGVVGLKGAGEREELVAAQRQVLGDLRSAQNKATSGAKKGGFGFRKTTDQSYTIYLRDYSDTSCATHWEYDCPGGASDCNFCDKDETEVSFKSNRVRFSGVTPDFEIYFFRSPNAGRARLVTDSGDPLSPDLAEGSVTIALVHDRLPTVSKNVRVEAAGDVARIYEE